MAQSFVVNPEEELNYLQQVGFDQVRVIRQGKEIVGGLALLPMGQWFGGKRVGMTGVASVAIAPHVRGQGVATFMMTSVVKELASQGMALSVLYPAVQALYQRVGYGLGGSRYTWRVATEHIQVNKTPLACHPLSTQAIDPQWHTLQQQLGRITAGRLERHVFLWQRLLKPPGDGTVFAYGIGDDNQSLRGYLVGYQERGTSGPTITLRDWAALTPEAMQSLWGLLHHQRAQVDWIQWAGGAVDPLALALPEQRAACRDQTLWMVRILDIEAALTQRGYPNGMDGELHLAIEDPLIAKNNGNFVLAIHNGVGQVASGGRGDVRMSIQSLASLFTGLRSAQELSALGKLDARPEVIALATAIFLGPSPWMPDFF
jgi:predicted acetyltransferase